VATLEGVQNAQRGTYFANARPKVSRATKELPDGQIKQGVLVEGDDSLHPGLHPPAAEWIAAATSLGLRFLRASRIGGPRPREVLANLAKEGTDKEQQDRLARFSEIVRAIEARGIGIARIKAIGERIKARTNFSGPWYAALDRAQDEQEHKEIERAISEWADGDTVAAHIAYGINVLCTEDRAGASIFDSSNRAWLEQTYGIRILSLKQLAAEIDK
jgi:hypothetical protein